MRHFVFILAGLLMFSCAKDLRIERGRVYAQPQEERLRATIYQPGGKVTGKRPGLVLIHGGGWLFGPRWQQLWYCHQFARAGFVVMSIDYRMMPRYPFPNCLHDCKAAVRWLRLHADEYGVDAERIVTFGASAGGHLAAFLAVTGPKDSFEGQENPGALSTVLAAISLYGVVDLTTYRNPHRPWPLDRLGGAYVRAFAGDVGAKQGMDPFEAASPVTYVTPDAAPVFLAHGIADKVVSYEQSVTMHEHLLAAGVPARLVSFPRRGHGFDYIHHAQRRALFDQMLRFLVEHIGQDGLSDRGNEAAEETTQNRRASTSDPK